MAKRNPFELSSSSKSNPFERLSSVDINKAQKGCSHVFGEGYKCSTDEIGYKNPRDRGPAELVLDASEGFIPLWDKNVTLRWRFNEK
jgi:hypothetical protein